MVALLVGGWQRFRLVGGEWHLGPAGAQAVGSRRRQGDACCRILDARERCARVARRFEAQHTPAPLTIAGVLVQYMYE